jgi:hypothetical protein
MPIRPLLVKASGPTNDVVLDRIKNIALNKANPISPRTCWNQVAMFLRSHPETTGFILFYTTPVNGFVDNYVNHAVLVDDRGHTLVDASNGTRSADNKFFLARGESEKMVLLSKHAWPLR